MATAIPEEKKQWPDISKLYENSAVVEKSIQETQSLREGSVSDSLPPDALSNNPSSYYTSYSYVGSSVTDAQSEDANTDDDEDVDDDEILSWVASGMLPVNSSTTLALNQAYQEILEQFMGRVEGTLAQIRERQKNVQNMMNQSCSSLNDKFRRPIKVPTVLYVCPYFRDTSGMCPGLNREAEKRRNEGVGDFDMLIESRPKWSKNEKAALFRGIGATAKQGQIDPLLAKKETLIEKANLDTAKVSDIKKCIDEASNIDKQITRLKRKEESDFLNTTNTANDIDWNLISVQFMNGVRTAAECKLAWKNKFILTSSKENPWTRDELNKLKKIAKNKHCRNWPEIARLLGTGRSAFECMEKYQTELNDNLVKRDWTEEDDEQLTDAVEQVRVGNFIPWEQIPFFMDGRTRIQCERHYKQCLNPSLKRGRWSEDEDMLLMRALDRYGERNWSKIAEFVGTRSEIQCRERWCMALSAHVKIDPWIRPEDATLLLGASTFGVGNWANIARLLPGRTASACKQRYKALRNFSRSKRKNGGPATINVSLGEDIETDDAKKSRAKLRSIFFAKRKERVRNWYEKKHGRTPLASKMVDVGAFLQTLPDSTRKIIHEKLILIQNVYGSIGRNKTKEVINKIKEGVQTRNRSATAAKNIENFLVQIQTRPQRKKRTKSNSRSSNRDSR